MTGYQEILTDPSYSRQIVTLTYPHIGNTGTNPDDHESNLVHAAGLVIRDLPLLHSSWRATESLPEFLRRRNTVAIAEIDTRKLTRILREKGAQAGCIASGDAALRPDLAIEAARRFPGPQGHGPRQGRLHRPGLPVERGHELVAGAGSAPPGRPAPARRGLRLRHQAQHPAPARRPRLPHDGGAGRRPRPRTSWRWRPMASSSRTAPAIPSRARTRSTATREFLANGTPVFGICLGHQILGLAVGAKTVKMKFGHHGANHPVLEIETGRVLITSQNHGFAVDETTLPPNVRSRTSRCSTARCRASPAPTVRRSASRVTPRPARVRATWCRCSRSSSNPCCARRAPRPMRKTV